MKLYIFAPLLPLAFLGDVLAWLLTAVGVLAASSQVLKFKLLKIPKKWLKRAAIVCLAGAAALFLFRSPSSGVRFSAPSQLPIIERDADAPQMEAGPLKIYSSFRELWSTLPARKALSPAAAWTVPESQAGLLLVGTQEGSLDAYDLVTGKLRWRVKKKAPILSAAIAPEDKIFFGEGLHTDYRASFTALEAKTGAALWQLEVPGHLEMAAAFIPGEEEALIFSAGGAGLFAVSALNGRVLWRQPLGHIDSTPLLRAGDEGRREIWVMAQREENSLKSKLYRLSASTGEWLGDADLQGQPWGSPQAALGSIFVTSGVGRLGAPASSDRGWLYRVDAGCKEESCTPVWMQTLETMAVPRISVLPSAGLVYVTLKSGKVQAYRLEKGELAWSFDMHAPTSAEAVLATTIPLEKEVQGKPRKLGVLLAATNSEGRAFLLDPYEGKLLKELETGRGSTTPPLFLDDRLFLVSPSVITAYGGTSKIAKARK